MVSENYKQICRGLITTKIHSLIYRQFRGLFIQIIFQGGGGENKPQSQAEGRVLISNDR